MTFFDEFIYWTGSMSREERQLASEDPRLLIKYALMMICANWKITLEYAATRMTQIEWQVENPSFNLRYKSEGLEGCMKRLHRWRRVLPTYQTMVSDVLFGILRQDHRLFKSSIQIAELRADYEKTLSQIKALQQRAECIVSLVGTLISAEESKKSVQQNEYVYRLTCLLGVFIPMSFLSSVFSMNGDLNNIKGTIWIYFAISIPLTLVCLLAIALLRSDTKILPWFQRTH
jgi:Mg2+ and Co2+ transporter CorA